MDRKTHGFSLVELLIVVAIILIIAATAIPNLLRAKIAANEASAVQSLRTLNAAATMYATSWGVDYPNTIAVLGGATDVPATCKLAELIDPQLAAAKAAPGKSGYKFTYTGTTASPAVKGCKGFEQYTISAVPLNIGLTGQRGFFTDESGVIRYTTNGKPPTIASPPLN